MGKWRDIDGFEGYYKISNCGLVKSLSRTVWNGKGYIETKEKILKPYMSKGYYKVDLYIEGKRKKKFIHQLVAETFIKNPHNKKTINHIDGNRLNNHHTNLEWNTYTEQELHKNREISGRKRGAYRYNDSGWEAKLTFKKKVYKLGVFSNKEDAHQAYYEKYLQIHGVRPW